MKPPHSRHFLIRFVVPLVLACAVSAEIRAQPAPVAADSNRNAARTALDEKKLREHVFTLASSEFAGRRGSAARKTIDYVRNFFDRHGLAPGFSQGYVQDVVQATSGQAIGHNIAGKVEGTDPVLKDEWIILSAHWDHLGPHARQEDAFFPGADDNASGLAMLLETAAWFSRTENRPKRSILFVAFDLEEFGLFGSRHFAANMPFEQDKLKLFVTADMIGRSLSGICKEWVFVIGSERLPQSREWLKAASDDRSVRAGLLGTDLVGVRSDYGPFMTKKIPYLFFSTGESQVYHSMNDRPETIDYAKLHQISEVIRETTARAADASRIEAWSDTPVQAPQEMAVIATVLEEMKKPDNGLKLGGFQRTTIDRTLERIRTLLVRTEISEAERRAVIRAAQFLMFTAL